MVACSAKTPVASFSKEVNLLLAKRPLVSNGRLANRGLTSLVKEATDRIYMCITGTLSLIRINSNLSMDK